MVASLSVPLPSHGFVKLPNVILLHPHLSLQAKLLYSILRRYARDKGYCFPGCVRLAQDMRRSERTVRRAMDELVAAGVVTKWRRGLKQTNVYYLASPEKDLSAPPDRTFLSSQERSFVTNKRDREEIEERESNSSKAPENLDIEGGNPPETNLIQHHQSPPCDPNRDRIRLLIFSIARQLNDRASLASTTSRLLNLMYRADISFEQFADAVYVARTRTLERGNIRSRNDRGPCRMGYFFSTLEDVLGLRQEENRGTPRLSTDEDGTLLSLAEAPPTLAADEGGMKQASPSRSWPSELIEMGIPDLPSYIRICKRGIFYDTAVTIAYARKRLRESRWQ